METFLFNSLIPVSLILIAWQAYRKPIKGDTALSVMWRGSLGGYASGYLSLFLFYGYHPYFFIALIYSFIFIPVFAMAFAGVVWLVQKRKPCGLLFRALIGAATGALGGTALGLVIYFFGDNQRSAWGSAGAWGISCLSIGIGAGIMAGPRRLPQPEED